VKSRERVFRAGPWARLAACRDAPGVDFYADGKTKRSVEGVERAKSVYGGCRVRLSCLEAGLGEQWGVWERPWLARAARGR
jgi:hypothetical protein